MHPVLLCCDACCYNKHLQGVRAWLIFVILRIRTQLVTIPVEVTSEHQPDAPRLQNTIILIPSHVIAKGYKHHVVNTGGYFGILQHAVVYTGNWTQSFPNAERVCFTTTLNAWCMKWRYMISGALQPRSRFPEFYIANVCSLLFFKIIVMQFRNRFVFRTHRIAVHCATYFFPKVWNY